MMASNLLAHIDELSSSVSSLQDLFNCPICLDLLEDPVRTSCGHIFCRMCIKRALRKLTKEPCPKCKTLLSYNKRDIIQDDTMSVFNGLLFDLIISINETIGFDITAHPTKPGSSYEASMNAEEFVSMKSNNVVAQKKSDLTMTSSRPLTDTRLSDTEYNFGAFKEFVEICDKKISDYIKTSPEKKSKLKIRKTDQVIPENITEKASPSSTEQVTPSTSKETVNNLKEIGENADKASSAPPRESDAEFNFLRPKPAKSMLKRKHTLSNDVSTKHDLTDGGRDGNDDTKEDNKKKKMKISVQEKKEKKIKDKKNITVEEEKVEDEEEEKVDNKDERQRKRRNMKISYEKRNMSIPEPSHVIPGSVNKNTSTTLTKSKTSGMKKTSLKKTVQSKMTKPLKRVARKSTKFAVNSTFIPKRLTDKTSKFYFTTSLVMRRVGQKPMSLMKRKYIVATKSSNSDGENPFTCSNTTLQSSNQSSDSTPRKSFTSVSVQTSPVKKQSAKTMEDIGNSANVGDATVNNDRLESQHILELGNVRERDVEKDSAIDEHVDQTKECTKNIVSQEEMDIFEAPTTEENISTKKPEEQDLKKAKEEKVDESDEYDSDATQVNPYIKNRNNPFTRRTVTPISARRVVGGSGKGKARCMKLVKQITVKSSHKEMKVEKETSNDEIRTSNVENAETTPSELREIRRQKHSVNEISPHGRKITVDERAQGHASTVDDELDENDRDANQVSTEEKGRWKENEDESKERQERTTKSEQKPETAVEGSKHSSDEDSPRRLSTSKNSDKRFSKTDSNTPPRKIDKNSSSPFLNSAGEKQISTENSVAESESSNEIPQTQIHQINKMSEEKCSKEGSNTPQRITDKKPVSTENTISEEQNIENVGDIPISEQLKLIQMSCRRKGVLNIGEVEERTLNESQLYGSLSRGLRGQLSQVIPSSDDFKFSQLTGQSVGDSQGRNMTQMDTAFCGSASGNSERMVTQQMTFQEQLDGAKETPPIVIDGSDDEEIPQTPNKAIESEILTQLNTSKLDRSIGDRSFIPSSLNFSQMASTSARVQKLTRTSKKQRLSQKKNKPNRPTEEIKFDNPKEKEDKPKKYSFVYSRLAPHLLQKLTEFAKKINANVLQEITEETTHVILAPVNDNKATITYKFLKGIARRLWVVSIDWVLTSLNANEIQPEELFLTLDPAGEPGPTRSKFNENLPLSNFIIVPRPPYGLMNEECLKELIVLCGGTLVERIEDLPQIEPNRPRILLTDEEIEAQAFESHLENDLIIPLRVEWLIDSIGAYKVANVSPHLHHRMKFKFDVLLRLGLSDEMIQGDSESDSDDAESDSD